MDGLIWVVAARKKNGRDDFELNSTSEGGSRQDEQGRGFLKSSTYCKLLLYKGRRARPMMWIAYPLPSALRYLDVWGRIASAILHSLLLSRFYRCVRTYRIRNPRAAALKSNAHRSIDPLCVHHGTSDSNKTSRFTTRLDSSTFLKNTIHLNFFLFILFLSHKTHFLTRTTVVFSTI